MAKKIRRKSAVGALSGAGSGRRSFRDRLRQNDMLDLLADARAAWDGLYAWRKKARRARDYTFGRQWNDIIKNPDWEAGKPGEKEYISEEMHISKQGKTPLKNNMIRALVRAISGQFLQNYAEPLAVTADRDEQTLGETATVLMQYNYTVNEMKQLDAALLMRLTISGACAVKVSHGYRHDRGRRDTWVDYVNPNKFFWNAGTSDIRLWDVNLIGEFQDMALEDIVATFATDSATAAGIREIYRTGATKPYQYSSDSLDNLTSRRIDSGDFLTPADAGMCRVIEVWRRETRRRYLCHDWAEGTLYKAESGEVGLIKAENAERLRLAAEAGIDPSDVALIEFEPIFDRFWVGRWLTPWGDVLRELESPYQHGEHPYVLALYPNYDGEVHSFVDDVIDQQRYINRLVTLYDFIMGTSAKGILLIPEESIPEDMTPEDFAKEWVRYDGVIVYKAKPGVAPPQQVQSSAVNVGALQMMELQMKLLTEISGISGALQGKQAKSGTASSLYAQETQNSANNLVELLTWFNSFRERRDKKMLQTDLQFYDEPRYINLVGLDAAEEARYYDPMKIKDVSFDVRIVEGVDTPAYRQVANEALMQFFMAGKLTMEDVLATGAFPFADKLQRRLDRAKAQAAEQSAMSPAPDGGGGEPEPLPEDITEGAA